MGMIHFLEQQKNHFLAELYEQRFQAAGQIYMDIVTQVETLSPFSENTQKILYQIQTIYTRFKPDLTEHCGPGITRYNLCLKKILSDVTRLSCRMIQYIDVSTWESKLGLSPHQKDLMYQTAMTFQLTSGCSSYCRRCNEWALPGVRSHFSYGAVLKILNHMADQGNDEISLYGASDPLDWNQGDKTISDIIDHLDTLPLAYSLLTKVPRGKAFLLKTLLKKRSNLSVSITSKNKARIKKIEQELGSPISAQHDLDELLIPAGLDEDFVTTKPSITDGYGAEITPDGAFIIIPTFTSALYPFGHQKIKITSQTSFFPIKKTGRQALLIDYFKPLEGYGRDQTLDHLPFLLDVQIESILLDNGSEQLTPPGMRSLKEYFSIFDENPRLQRKKMTASVMRRLKKQFLHNTSFKDLSEIDKAIYTQKILRHIHLCQTTNCISSKLAAVSFFLKSICDYIPQNGVKVKIIQSLLKDEFQNIGDAVTHKIANRLPQEVLTDPGINSFTVFRGYVFCLLNRCNDRPLIEFIRSHPAAYDPVADIFAIRHQPFDGISHKTI